MKVVLHTLSAAPSSAAFRDCLKVLQQGDALVLMGDGVYVSLPGTRPCQAVQATGAELYVLGADARLAGVTKPADSIRSIDMDDLVALTERYCRQLAWY